MPITDLATNRNSEAQEVQSDRVIFQPPRDEDRSHS